MSFHIERMDGARVPPAKPLWRGEAHLKRKQPIMEPEPESTPVRNTWMCCTCGLIVVRIPLTPRQIRAGKMAEKGCAGCGCGIFEKIRDEEQLNAIRAM